MARIFVAVDLPEEFRDEVRSIQSRFSGLKLKLVDPELVHVTMKFIGEVKESAVPEVAEALGNVRCRSFDALIGGIGVFPKPKAPRVLWLGAEGNFELLHDEVESSLSKFRFKKDKKKFTAHATLARIKFMPAGQKDEFLELLDELGDVELGKMVVDRISLKKSTLTPQGPIYETLHEVMLE
ncbi:RNA 2',3'-cyclic phosphodiesterase [Methanococcoides sp. LMO-2]|uniref:RNA 2',3'-cyclic phosphodiesterase n=1 Tax=Methanococcoides cohabitans TaxID=3136559 RepID=A0ABU9KV41_9EURY